MDKRGLPYAIVAVLLMVVLVAVLPAIDRSIAWSDETQPGDVIDLGEGVVVTPPVGWLLESGQRTTDTSATPVAADGAFAMVVTGGFSLSTSGSLWNDDAGALLDQVNSLRASPEDDVFKVVGSRRSFTTSTGITGVVESFTSASGSGEFYAFVVDRGDDPSVGVVVAANGTEKSNTRHGAAVEDMVSSLSYEEPRS